MKHDGLYGCYYGFKATILHTFGVQDLGYPSHGESHGEESGT